MVSSNLRAETSNFSLKPISMTRSLVSEIATFLMKTSLSICDTQLSQAKAELGFAPHPSRHILTRADGSAMDYHAMARVMVRERKRLGLMAFDQHALRYRGVMELAWAGCTDDEIASFSGHTSKAMIIKYAGEARQIMRARQAAAKRK